MAKKRTTAQRRAAAKASWERRRLGLGPLFKRRGKKKSALDKMAARMAGTQIGREVIARRAKNTTAEIHPGTAENAHHGYLISTPGYDILAKELHSAFLQSAEGKGKERHANGKAFDRQPIMEIGRMVGPAYTAGQAQKKAQEAMGMHKRGETDRAIAELHGAIVYLAATAALLREG